MQGLWIELASRWKALGWARQRSFRSQSAARIGVRTLSRRMDSKASAASLREDCPIRRSRGSAVSGRRMLVSGQLLRQRRPVRTGSQGRVPRGNSCVRRRHAARPGSIHGRTASLRHHNFRALDQLATARDHPKPNHHRSGPPDRLQPYPRALGSATRGWPRSAVGARHRRVASSSP